MENEEYLAQLEQEFERARVEMFKCKPKNSGGQTAEERYGAAYQRLVRAGKRVQIKKKYR